VVVVGCEIGIGAGGVKVMIFDSLVFIIRIKFARFSLVMRLASACFANCFSIAWNHSMSIVTDLTVFRVFWRGIRG
jgi:hypothetical protein